VSIHLWLALLLILNLGRIFFSDCVTWGVQRLDRATQNREVSRERRKKTEAGWQGLEEDD
jgi:hypothetical protein